MGLMIIMMAMIRRGKFNYVPIAVPNYENDDNDDVYKHLWW